jgi:hypothetical protein
MWNPRQGNCPISHGGRAVGQAWRTSDPIQTALRNKIFPVLQITVAVLENELAQHG